MHGSLARIDIGSLPDWPPLPACKKMDPSHYEGTFEGCEFIGRTPQHESHLLVKILRNGVKSTAVYSHPSSILLRRLEATLRGKEGMPLRDVRGLSLVEVNESLAQDK